MGATTDADAVAAVDNVRRTLVLLGALLFPLSDERAALKAGDAARYVDAIAARMRGMCGQSAATIENACKVLADPAAAKNAKKSPRRRAKAQPLAELSDGVRAEVEAIFAQYGLPDASRWPQKGKPPGLEPSAGLFELISLAARLAATSLHLAALAAGHIEPASDQASDVDPSPVEAMVNGTRRTARRIAMVIDGWDLLADSPEAIIGCPPRPGPVAGSPEPRPAQAANGKRSLGVAAALGAFDGRTSGRSTAGRDRSQPVWSAGGAIQRD